MIAVLVAGLLPFAMPWEKIPPPPAKSELVLTQPEPADPPPEGSVIDVPAPRELPENWRTSESASMKRRENAGMDYLLASGSGQFCRDQFYALRGVLKGRNVVVVDLRQEPHTFLNGAAISWGPPEVIGADHTASEVERLEEAWTQRLDAGKFTTIASYASGTFADTKAWWPLQLKLDIRSAAVESRVVAEASWTYLRIAAPDTVLPREQDLDRLVYFVSKLEQQENVWMHFHCDTGGNRTSLYLTLYDMMRSYASASRSEIIERQHQLGGIDLLAGPHKAERGEFLERFYSYCWQCGPLFRRSWSSWNRAQLRRGD